MIAWMSLDTGLISSGSILAEFTPNSPRIHPEHRIPNISQSRQYSVHFQHSGVASGIVAPQFCGFLLCKTVQDKTVHLRILQCKTVPQVLASARLISVCANLYGISAYANNLCPHPAAIPCLLLILLRCWLLCGFHTTLHILDVTVDALIPAVWYLHVAVPTQVQNHIVQASLGLHADGNMH